jgi:hypothetical protein
LSDDKYPVKNKKYKNIPMGLVLINYNLDTEFYADFRNVEKLTKKFPKN